MAKRISLKMATRALIFSTLCLVMLIGSAQGQDVHVPIYNSANPLISGQQWGGLNRVFIFRPIQPANTVYIFISNLNASNSHTFTLNVFQTANNLVTDYTNNTGLWMASTINYCSGSAVSPVAASTTVCLYLSVAHAAQIAIQMGGITQAGGDDRANVDVVQSSVAPPGPLGSGSQKVQGPDPTGSAPTFNGFRILGKTAFNNTALAPYVVGPNGGFPQAGASTSFGTSRSNSFDAVVDDHGNNVFQPTVGEGLCGNGLYCDGFSGPATIIEANAATASKGYVVNSASVNPGAAADLLNFWNQSGTGRWFFLENVTITCTAACEIRLYKVSTQGSTCTTVTPVNSEIAAGAGSSITSIQKLCTTPPTLGTALYDWFFPANAVQQIDLRGLMIKGSSGSAGFEFNNVTSIGAGTVTVGLKWSEQ